MLNPLIISTAMLPLRMSSPCAERSQSIYPRQGQRVIRRNLCALYPSELCVKSFPIRASSTFFAFFEKQRTKVDPLTPSFSIAASHFFALFFTLAEISPLRATHTKNTGGYTPARHQIGTIVPMRDP